MLFGLILIFNLGLGALLLILGFTTIKQLALGRVDKVIDVGILA